MEATLEPIEWRAGEPNTARPQRGNVPSYTDVLMARNAELLTQNDELGKLVESYRELEAALKRKITELREQVDALSTENEELRNQVNHYSQLEDILNGSIAELRVEKQDLVDQCHDLQVQIDELLKENAVVDELRALNHELAKTCEWWKNEHDMLSAQMEVVRLIFGGET